MLYRPEYVLLIGWVTHFAIYLAAPVVVRVDVFSGSLFFIALCTLAFILGSRTANQFVYKESCYQLAAADKLGKALSLFNIFLCLGLIGNALRIVDKYVLRASGAGGVLDAREMLIDTSSSLVGMIGAVLYPFGYLAFFIYIGAQCIPRSNWRLLVALGVFLIPSMDGLLLYSRSYMLVAIAMLYFGVSTALYRGRLCPRQIVLPIALGVFAVSIISVLVFLLRIGEMQLDLSFSMFQSAYAYTVQPDSAVTDSLYGGGYVTSFLVGLLLLAQYYIHGFFEFQLLWSNFDTQVFANGALLFSPFLKVFNLAGMESTLDLSEHFQRVGVFTTLYGPLWVDFGWLSPFVMFFFGVLARRFAMASERGDFSSMPLYAYMCVILFFAPVVNFAISAQGMYCIIAFTIFWLAARKVSRAQTLR